MAKTAISFDIMHDILLNLPVKTLFRFKSVSKQWHSLISDPLFQEQHYFHCSQQDPIVLLTKNMFNDLSGTNTLHLSTYNYTKETLTNNFIKSVPNPLDKTAMYAIATCQGLVCILGNFNEHIFIYNPSTAEIIKLPPNNGDIKNIGLGYSVSAKEFKVTSFGNRGTKNFCEIFNLGTSRWREGRRPPWRYGKYFWQEAPFFGGAIHLLPIPGYGEDIVDSIYTFNIENEEYGSIRLPEYNQSVGARESPLTHMYLKVLGGSLFLAVNFQTTLELWHLKDYNNGEWVKKYNIDLGSFGSLVRGIAVAIMKDGSILLIICHRLANPLLYCYRPRNKTFSQKTTETYSNAVGYVESFLSLGGSPQPYQINR